jgi:hypothetical protein
VNAIARLRANGILGGAPPPTADDAPDGEARPPASSGPQTARPPEPASEVVETP